MFVSRQHVAALSLVASLALAGCGAPTAGMIAPASKLGKSAPSVVRMPAPSVTITQGAAGRQVNVPASALKASSLRVVGSAEMGEDELAEMADSLGFSVAAESSLGLKFSKSGLVRSTETGFAFVTTTGLFKKTETTYTLDATPELLDQLSDRQNKKALIKGVVYSNNHVKVASVKAELNLAALFNTFTKGKVVGHVVGTDGEAMGGVKVQLKSAEGFTFSALSDAEGEYEIKGLVPGAYKASLTKDGFKAVADQAITVEKRHSVKLEGELVAETPVPAPTATPDPETDNVVAPGGGN